MFGVAICKAYFMCEKRAHDVDEKIYELAIGLCHLRN